MGDTPNVRFRGFTDDWEQRKLGEIGSIQTCKRIFKEQTQSEGEVPFYKNGTLGLKADAYISKETYEEYKRLYPFPKIGDVLMSVVGSIGRTAEYKGDDEYFQDSNIVWLDTDNMIVDKKFLQISYQIVDWIIEGSTIKHLYNDNILLSKIWLPALNEQEKIGKLFYTLDCRITLHQHKCNEIEELKKYMLQKMFPQNGNKIPEIRFAGFTDEWEERKLNEIAEKVTEKNKYNIYNEPLTNSAELGIISQKDYFEREVVNEENLGGYYVVRNDDFVYNPRVSITAPVGPINRNRLGRNGVMSPLYTIFRTHEINTLYLEYYFKTTNWHRFMKLNGDSGARFDRFTIATSQFMEMPIPCPDVEEQLKIGQYFDNLDNLITLHQHKCDELKEVKKFMLQNMFPQKG